MPLLYVSTFKMYADIYFSTLLPQVDFNLPFFFIIIKYVCSWQNLLGFYNIFRLLLGIPE